jgi:predicted transcriptional regulator
VTQPPIPPEILDELNAAQEAFERTAVEARAAAQRRARAVAAAAEAGMTRRDIGEHLGLTRGRVQQIIDSRPR